MGDPSMGCFRRTLPDGQIENKCSPFQNIIEAHYWGFTTVTTVGYGDGLPTSYIGMFLSCASMVLGIFSLALPIGLTATVFTDAVKKAQQGKKKQHEDTKALRNGLRSGELISLNSSFSPRSQELNEANEYTR